MDWAMLTAVISREDEERVVNEACARLSGLPFAAVVDLDSIGPRALTAVNASLAAFRLNVPPDLTAALAERVVGRINGLDFLLPIFKREDISEITINPNGSLWILKKGAHDFELHTPKLDPQAVNRAVEALLRPLGRALNEAVPSVDAKLPRVTSLPSLKGGARLKLLHPCIVPPGDYPSVNIRVFEPRPVPPQQLIAWQVAPEKVIGGLLDCVASKARVLVIGGTGSGKTTFLSALCSAIPKDARVVKIEDPEEIWVEHPNMVTLEARTAPLGSTSVQDYRLRNGVDDAMRMSPRWLIVGEVRTGDAAAALFRAQMSDHPGLSTFHADSPEAAVERMALIMKMDAGLEPDASRRLFATAVDLIAQVGWDSNQRRALVGVWEVEKNLEAERVAFRPLYEPGRVQMDPMRRR